MGSRYALRSLECAIGYDCRRLEDGRKAVFRHTALSRRARMEFYERRDMMSVLESSLIAYAAFSSHIRVSPEAALDSIGIDRKSLLRIAFPYVDMSGDGNKDKIDPSSEYDQYFDELDAMENARKERESRDEKHLDDDGKNDDGVKSQEMI